MPFTVIPPRKSLTAGLALCSDIRYILTHLGPCPVVGPVVFNSFFVVVKPSLAFEALYYRSLTRQLWFPVLVFLVFTLKQLAAVLVILCAIDFTYLKSLLSLCHLPQHHRYPDRDWPVNVVSYDIGTGSEVSTYRCYSQQMKDQPHSIVS